MSNMQKVANRMLRRNNMKYYYGNSVKEALSNKPIDINSTRVLAQYQEQYTVVIPHCENSLCKFLDQLMNS